MNVKEFFMILPVTDSDCGYKVCDPVMRSITGANHVCGKAGVCAMKLLTRKGDLIEEQGISYLSEIDAERVLSCSGI